MQPFGGFIMPIQYSNITDEHNAVRQHCGVFDVSHMGEVTVKGPDAERYVSHIFTTVLVAHHAVETTYVELSLARFSTA